MLNATWVVYFKHSFQDGGGGQKPHIEVKPQLQN